MKQSGFVLAVLLTAGAGAQSVRPYSVSGDFHEVANYKQFTKLGLEKDHWDKLKKNLFVAYPRGGEQLWYVYGDNDYNDIPSFVTADNVLQLYHVFFDSTLRSVEEKKLYTLCEGITKNVLKNLKSDYAATKDPGLRAAVMRDIAYFAVATQLLGQRPSVPNESLALAQAELSRINASGGPSESAIFGTKVDYSQFKPRGHYTKTERLKRYFRTMMWYGLVPFEMAPEKDMQIRQALLVVRALFNSPTASANWQMLYDTTSLFSGHANNLTPGEVQQTATKIFGKGLPLTALADGAKFHQFKAAAQKMRPALIQAKRFSDDNFQKSAMQFKLMGQRYILDSDAMQQLVELQKREFPSGLDVMAILGSQRAAQILDSKASIFNPGGWADYPQIRSKFAANVAAMPASAWDDNLYWGWLDTLRAEIKQVPEGYPSFMRNRAWADKSLTSALASWAELRHDTILYGTQSVAEMGDGDEPKHPAVKGYVEPAVAVYDRLLSLIAKTRKELSSRNLLETSAKKDLRAFEELVAFLKSCSVKELVNKPLTRAEHLRIRKIEGEFDELSSQMLLRGNNFQRLSWEDENMAQIADVHTGSAEALEVGAGQAEDIVVIVPIDGKLYFARGGVFSYYEFKVPLAQRLTDKEWKEMLNDDKAPARPFWVSSFFVNKRPGD